jgi:riboflavin synthase
VEKGSITIDGISLTIVDCGKDWLSVSLVDYTIEHTTLGAKKIGELVNLEFDIMAKYVARMMKR